jgi:hypothetical protein
MLSEILTPLLGRHQKLSLSKLRWRKTFSHKSELEAVDDLVDDSHLRSTFRAKQWIDLLNFAANLAPLLKPLSIA